VHYRRRHLVDDARNNQILKNNDQQKLKLRIDEVARWTRERRVQRGEGVDSGAVNFDSLNFISPMEM
jgi:hypothetical protein